MDNSSFEMNKIVGAVLLAGLIAMFAGIGSEMLYHGGAPEGQDKRGYSIEVAEETSGGTASAEPAAPVDIAEFMATADAAAGEKLLKKCTACHTFDNGGKHGVGPNQWKIVGRAIASASGYSYSDALNAMKGKTWGEQELSEFLTKPKAFAPGNKMAFAGIKKPQDRANLIAYLKTLR
ncbi:MAG: c-type cytochrome [Rickettsiales bacterium]